MTSHPDKDQVIEKLESIVAGNPANKPSTRMLLEELDRHLPARRGLGPYSDCQQEFADSFGSQDLTHEFLLNGDVAGFCRKWQNTLDRKGLVPQISIAQLFAGNAIEIGGVQGLCGSRLSFFDSKAVISALCFSCYKVQILPKDLATMISVYFVLRMMQLPRNNARKCMVEVREAVAFPYKGYIFCESEDEAQACHLQLKVALSACQISGVYSGISHGCSEYGLKYPDFKYSPTGSHRSFERPAHWDALEAQFLANLKEVPRAKAGHDKQFISIRDVVGLQTWIDYAEIIGDATSKKYRETPRDYIPEPFSTRVKRQAEMRNRQLVELRSKLAS
jgi:hypothetical protein